MDNSIEFRKVLNSTDVDREVTDAVERVRIKMSSVIGIETKGNGDEFLNNRGSYVKLSVGSKMDKVPGAVLGNIAVFNSAGQVVDSKDSFKDLSAFQSAILASVQSAVAAANMAKQDAADTKRTLEYGIANTQLMTN